MIMISLCIPLCGSRVSQDLANGKLASQYALYSAMFGWLHSNICKKIAQKESYFEYK